MGVLDELKKLSAAEDFFQFLGVIYDPKVLHVARLHIMKRMGQFLAAEDTSKSEDELWLACKQHLEAAYATFTNRSPIEERLFKVHKDAVREQAPEPKRFVQLTPIKKD